MKSGDCWEPTCSKCGKTDGSRAEFRTERPDWTPPPCGWCLAPGDDAVWEHSVIRPLGYMRLSGFSTSESDFTPHFNTSLGQHVESLSHMKALQAASGAVDAVVKGDGADRHAPRDIATRFKHHREVHEAIDSGRPLRPANGIEVRYVGDE